MSLTKQRESLVSDIPAGDGKISNLFLQCTGSGICLKNLFLLTGRQCRG
jgi:hypothetical protein